MIAAGDARSSARQLVACVVHRPEETGESLQCAEPEILKDGVRDFLRDYLPEYMIPRHFVFLDQLPLNATGKLDRKALSAHADEAAHASEYVAPQNERQGIICRIWAQVLEVERVGIHDNFFDLGGDSLKVIMLKNRLRRELAYDIPLTEIYKYPTVCTFSDYLEAGPRPMMSSAPQKKGQLRTWLDDFINVVGVIIKHIRTNGLSIISKFQARCDDDAIDAGISGEYDDQALLAAFREIIDDAEAVDIRHAQVGDHHREFSCGP